MPAGSTNRAGASPRATDWRAPIWATTSRPTARDVTHWRHSPILAEQAGLPPTLLVTAALDPLRDEGRAYAARAIEAGVQLTYREIAGTIHGFASYRRVIPSAQADLAAVLALARAMIAEAQAAGRG